jgi:hypothetical protein
MPLGQLLQQAREHEVLLLEPVEGRVLLPGRVGEAGVAIRLDSAWEVVAERPARRRDVGLERACGVAARRGERRPGIPCEPERDLAERA